MLFHERAFDGDHKQKIQDAAIQALTSTSRFIDPLKEEEIPDEPLLIPARLTNHQVVGFLIHFVSPDPKFSLLECVSEQARANSSRARFSHSMSSSQRPGLPNSDEDIKSIGGLVALLNAYRRDLGLKEIEVKQSHNLQRLTREAFPSFPMNEDELCTFLKSKKVNEAQRLKRTFVDAGGKYYFYFPLPPLAYEPENPKNLISTAFPTFVANDLFGRLVPRLPRVYGNLYQMSQINSVRDQLCACLHRRERCELRPTPTV